MLNARHKPVFNIGNIKNEDIWTQVSKYDGLFRCMVATAYSLNIEPIKEGSCTWNEDLKTWNWEGDITCVSNVTEGYVCPTRSWKVLTNEDFIINNKDYLIFNNSESVNRNKTIVTRKVVKFDDTPRSVGGVSAFRGQVAILRKDYSWAEKYGLSINSQNENILWNIFSRSEIFIHEMHEYIQYECLAERKKFNAEEQLNEIRQINFQYSNKFNHFLNVHEYELFNILQEKSKR